MSGYSIVEVSDQLIEQMGDKWSEPVQFRFRRISDDLVDMDFRYVPWPSLTRPSGPKEATRETRG